MLTGPLVIRPGTAIPANSPINATFAISYKTI
jgi:hypothetical protein